MTFGKKVVFNRVTIDVIAQNDASGAYSLYLRERADGAAEIARQREIQARIYTALDVILDGQLASDYPDSRGKHVRVVVTFDGAVPEPAILLIERLNAFVLENPDYAQSAIRRGVASGLEVGYKVVE